MSIVARREFLRGAGWAAAGAHMANRLLGNGFFHEMPVLAQSSTGNSGYKALVVIFLYGGNDANNMLVPLDETRYSQYSSSRGALAISQAALLQLGSTNYGLHPGMPNTVNLFNTGGAALISNIGPLAEPTTLAQAQEMLVQLPLNLQSHGDQQRIQQTCLAGSERTGAGGVIAESMPSLGPSNLPMVISLTGEDDTFINGRTSTGFIAPTGGADYRCTRYTACNAANNMSSALSLLPAIGAIAEIAQQNKVTTDQSIAIYNSVLSSAAPLKTVFPNNGLGNTSKQMILTMQAEASLGTQRQIFFLSCGGFDTHAMQLGLHAALLSALDAIIPAIVSGLQEIGLYESVVIAPMSEFNRTLRPNASLGSDHAWGSHQLVFGGPIKGGQVYGQFPSPTLRGPNDLQGTGVYVPTTPTVQFAADLAAWFGVPTGELSTVFPLLANFSNNPIGFV